MYQNKHSSYWKTTCLVCVDTEYWQASNGISWLTQLSCVPLQPNQLKPFNVTIMPPVVCGTIKNAFWQTMDTCQDKSAQWPATAMCAFFTYLRQCLEAAGRQCRTVTLCAHGLIHGDLPVVRRLLQKFHIMCPRWVSWFDTLPYFRTIMPSESSYKLQALAESMGHLSGYTSHNALSDAMQLKAMLLDTLKHNKLYGPIFNLVSYTCAEVTHRGSTLHKLQQQNIYDIGALTFYLRTHKDFNGNNAKYLLQKSLSIPEDCATALAMRCSNWYITNA